MTVRESSVDLLWNNYYLQAPKHPETHTRAMFAPLSMMHYMTSYTESVVSAVTGLRSLRCASWKRHPHVDAAVMVTSAHTKGIHPKTVSAE